MSESSQRIHGISELNYLLKKFAGRSILSDVRRTSSIAAVTTMLCAFAVLAAPVSHAAVVQNGAFGETLSIPNNVLTKSQLVAVTGKGFDETVGIYLAYCVLPKPGALPTPCGGGVNKSGIGDSSYWISSNPPPYGVGLAEPFLPGGRFTREIQVSTKIGKVDCTRAKCAVVVRSDHLHEGDRTHDIFIPITFTTKKK